MKTKISWKPGNRNADRSIGTVRKVSASTELFAQILRSRSIAGLN